MNLSQRVEKGQFAEAGFIAATGAAIFESPKALDLVTQVSPHLADVLGQVGEGFILVSAVYTGRLALGWIRQHIDSPDASYQLPGNRISEN